MHWYAKLGEIMTIPFEKDFKLFEALFNVYIAPSTLCNPYDKFDDDYISIQGRFSRKKVEEKQLKYKGVYK